MYPKTERMTTMTVSRLSLVLGCCLYLGPLLPGAEPSPAGLVSQIKVTNDKAPDCSTLKSIVESVTRDCKTNDEKAMIRRLAAIGKPRSSCDRQVPSSTTPTPPSRAAPECSFALCRRPDWPSAEGGRDGHLPKVIGHRTGQQE